MKRIINLILFSTLLLTACSQTENKGTNTPIQKNPELKITEEQAKKLEEDISGRWMWQAKKDNKIIGMGEFDLKQENNKISGVTKIIVPGLKAIPGRGGDPKATVAVTVIPLNGSRQKNHIEFNVIDEKGQKTSNEALIENQGMVLNGKSKQELNLNEVDSMKFQNANIKEIIEYDWEAEKVSEPEVTNKK